MMKHENEIREMELALKGQGMAWKGNPAKYSEKIQVLIKEGEHGGDYC